MASIFTRRPLLTRATTLTVLASAYYISRPLPLMMDSAQNTPAKTLSLPTNMLFSKQLKVVNVKQVNHDTKRITFELPGGTGEVSGVTPGGRRIHETCAIDARLGANETQQPQSSPNTHPKAPGSPSSGPTHPYTTSNSAASSSCS